MLVLRRHAEVGQDERDHEHVVQAKGLLDDVPEEVPQRGASAVEVFAGSAPDAQRVILVQIEDRDAEKQRQDDPDKLRALIGGIWG